MEKLKYILFGLACGVLASGLVLLISTPPRGIPVQLAPPPTPSPLLVDISGAVTDPGVYELPREARMQDAIQMAGGFLLDADTDAVNLAARVMDGQKIIIPQQGEPVSEFKSSPVNDVADPASASDIQPININTATQEELETLPGIGPSKAQAILVYREENGAFKTIEDILEVPGIGEKTLAGFLDMIIIQ